MRPIRKTAVLIALACIVLPRGAHAEDAEAAARRGTRLYEEGRYEEAAEAFQRAQELAREKGDPPPAFDYNLGTTYARRGDFDRAVETLREAAEAPEPEETPAVRERAFYNLGVSAARKAETLRQQGESQLDAEQEALRQALEAFRQSLILEPGDENARHNFALTRRRLDEIEKLMQQQQQDQQEQSEASDRQQGDGQEQQEQQSGGESSGSENQESSEQTSDTGESEPSEGGESSESQENPSQPSDAPQEHQEQPSDSESPGDAETGEQQGSPETEEGSTRESGDAEPSRNREDEQPAASEKEQRGGLEATPTPRPERAQGAPESQPGEEPSHPERSETRAGGAGGSGSADELTPEQLDALRVLNSLEEGHPDQFKQLFRFRGGGEGRNLERDW